MLMNETNRVVQSLFEGCRRDHASWVNGDPSGYALPENATLMGAFGGTTLGGRKTAHRQRARNSMWETGTGEVELVAGGVSDGIAWLVMVEHASVMFTGRPDESRWDLRVNELFRRNGESWERFHRHADPLVDAHSLDEVLRLLG
jgi:hypothetical protein